ncbi:virB8 family protein [Mycobacterium kansasii]|nr:virB8 family protein [Mycobacterium kansasii]
MLVKHRDATRHRDRVAEFAAAARQGVVTLTSLDFTNAKQGVQRILDNSTGTFRDDMAKVADDFIKVVEQSKVVEQGTVQAVAVDVDTMTDDSAVVLVASTSEVTNAAGARQDPRKFRLIVTITRDGDQLKMSKVEFVP